MKHSSKKLVAFTFTALFAVASIAPLTPATAQGLTTAGLTDTVGSVLKGKKKGPKGVHCGSRFVTEYNYDAAGNVKCYVHNSELSCKNGFGFAQGSADRKMDGDGNARQAGYRCVDHGALGLPMLETEGKKKRSCRRGFDRTKPDADGSYMCESRALNCPKGYQYVKGDVYPSGFAYFCHKG
ncbi:MAG: hypothetical protein ACPG06_03155 [Alphaproteobacteria bacterium]